jgi:hypothetical protein
MTTIVIEALLFFFTLFFLTSTVIAVNILVPYHALHSHHLVAPRSICMWEFLLAQLFCFVSVFVIFFACFMCSSFVLFFYPDRPFAPSFTISYYQT